MTRPSTSFRTTLSDDNYILRDHVVHGAHVMPGVACLELVCRIARARRFAAGAIELRNVVFRAPIVVTPGHARVLEATFTPLAEGHRVALRCQAEAATDDGAWTEILDCELRDVAPPAAPIDIAGLKAQATERFDLDQVYAAARRLDIRHGEFMKPSGTVHAGADFLLAELRLSPLGRHYLDRFTIHPVFLDSATLLAFGHAATAPAAAEKPSIPLSIESFQLAGPIAEPCYVHVRRQDSRIGVGEVAYGSVGLHDAQGNLVALLRRLAVKQIRSPALIRGGAPAGQGDGASDRAPPSAAPPPGPAAGDLDELAEALRHIVAEATGRAAGSIDRSSNFYDLGLASVDLLQVVRHLEQRSGQEIYPTLLFEHSTIDQLAAHLLSSGPDLRARLTARPAGRAEAAAAPEPAAPLAAPALPAGGDVDIAVIGMAGRYPMADTLQAFWDNLVQGRDCVTEVPSDRWRADDYYTTDPEADGKSVSKWGGWLNDVDCFDARFFGISPLQAEMMDPQERLFLETAWATLEDAGYTREALARQLGGAVGVFAGVMWSDYQLFGLEALHRGGNPAANSWFSSIPNRVSYQFDLKGPSVPIDTACSSSLSAIHLACESLRRGECAMALAGGVNLSLHPSKYIKLSRFRMLSPEGRCRSFGARAAGYVPGEGTGAILLRPLPAALAARDHIYGVIKGTVVNHVGKGSGYAVPHPVSQAELVAAALRRTGIDPRSITCIEAHGTGTALGDPIEVEGLTRAFGAQTRERQFCSLGSVKSNIGHLESAAGIAAMTKVLLQLAHRTLVPTLHSAEPNPKIDFASTPFYLQQEVAPWQPAPGSPRRAGVSSFGAGGVNAHVVIEEYPAAPATDAGAGDGEQLLLLSARDEPTLRNLATALRDRLAAADGRQRLADVAHTLMVGREALPHRLAILASRTEEAVQRLQAHLDGAAMEPGRLAGRAPAAKPDPQAEDAVEAGFAALRRAGDWLPLARLWISGVPIDWERLPDAAARRRVPLPTYPFARRRHWIAMPQGGTPQAGTPPAAAPARPPRIDERPLSRGDFYVADHVVAGRPIVPGVVFLELVRAAAEAHGGQPLRRWRNIVWPAPLPIGTEPVTPRIRLDSIEGGLEFQLCTGSEATPVVHAQGRLLHAPSAVAEPALPPAVIQARCHRRHDAAELYASFTTAGLAYGPGLRPIEALWVGEGECLARLRLPPHLQATRDDYVLHPAIADGCLQAIAGLVGESETFLPFELGELELFAPLPANCYAHARRGESTGAMLRFGITLLDEQGQPLARLRDFRVRRLAARPAPAREPAAAAAAPSLLCVPAWTARPLARSPIEQRPLVVLGEATALAALRAGVAPSGAPALIAVLPGERFVALEDGSFRLRVQEEEDYARLWEALKARGAWPAHLLSIAAATQADSFAALHATTALARSLLRLRLTAPLQALCVVEAPWARMPPALGMLAGLLRSVRLENPRLRWKQVGVESLADRAADVIAELGDSADQEVRFQGDVRHVCGLQALPGAPVAPLPLKSRGSYLISGGAGGLGLAIARHLARDHAARLMLLGRAAPQQRHRDMVAELQAAGGEAVYQPCDVTVAAEVEAAVRALRQRFGRIDGVIHCAGVIEDAMLERKAPDAFARVVAPKTLGTLHLDAATAADGLDLFALFSSITSVVGNYGQSDYAAANRFLDEFAHWREAERQAGRRHGRSLSINWPLWREGGMHMTPEAEAMMRRATGMVPLEVAAGIAAWQACLRQDRPQIVVLHGDQARIAAQFGIAAAAEPPPAATPSVTPAPAARPAAAAHSSAAAIRATLLQCAAEVLKLDPSEIDTAQDFGDFGFDSITLTQLANRLNERLGTSITPAQLFEHPTPDALIAFLGASQATSSDSGVAANMEAPMPTPVAMAAPEPAPAPPATEGSAAAQLDQIRRIVIRAVCEVLKIAEDDIEPEQDMGDLGFDSITLTQLANRLNEAHQLDLTPATLYEHASADALARHLQDQYPARWAAAAPPVAQPAKPVAQHAAPAAAPVTAAAAAASARPATSAGAPRPASDGYMPIAIIGMSGRLPGSPDIETYWQHLDAGDDLVTEIPPDRFDWREVFGDPARGENKTNSKWGGFMPEVDRFDAQFFHISPREAALMDPQHRLFLETVWKTIEHAGYRASQLAGTRTGIFAGVSTNDYSELVIKRVREVDAYVSTGNAHSVLPNRISYLLNLCGPSETVDTACSSALVAIHRAVRALQSGDCDLALAGGVAVNLTPTAFIAFSKAGMLSPDGRCKTFDASANGYVRGEGCGAVLLKPLHRAIEDGDHIHAVIRGSAVNHGGKAKSLTAPNPNAQVELLLQAYLGCGVDIDQVGYVEAHGTGTSLGDPIEFNGLKKAFAIMQQRSGVALPERSIVLGSVKSNIGHLEAAAGIAGVFKLALALRHRRLPGTIHVRTVNPQIDLGGSPFRILNHTTDWQPPADGRPRCAGVSSFGFGGANAHLVLEEYPQPPQAPPPEGEQVFILSARGATELADYARRMLAHVEAAGPELDLAALAATLQHGREPMECRLGFVFRDREELRARLRAIVADDRAAMAQEVFTGTGQDTQGIAKVLRSDASFGDYVNSLAARKELRQLARLWASGVEVDWAIAFPGPRRRAPLPTYPFRRDRHWLPEGELPTAITAAALAPLLDANTSTLQEQRFEKTFSASEPLLAEHVIAKRRLLPGAALVEMALSAGRLASGDEAAYRLDHLTWTRPLVLDEGQATLAISLHPEGEALLFEIGPAAGSPLAAGRLSPAVPGRAAPRLDLAALRSRLPRQAEGRAFYEQLAEAGFAYGAAFRPVQELAVGAEAALAAIALPSLQGVPLAGCILAPTLLDGAFQTVAALCGSEGGGLPYAIAGLEVLQPGVPVRHALAERAGTEGGDIRHFRLQLLAEDGSAVVTVERFSLKAAGRLAMPAEARQPAAASEPSDVEAWLRATLTDLTAKVSKVNAADVDAAQDLDSYGFDSIMVAQFVNELNDLLGTDLRPVDLYQFTSVEALAGHLASNYRTEVLRRMPGTAAGPATVAAVEDIASAPPVDAEAPAKPRLPRFKAAATPATAPTTPEPVAIIGMSGMFPQSPDLGAFWELLLRGGDAITEIPPDRFDWRRYFGDPAKPGNFTDSKWGGFMTGIDGFDAGFFGISPREADYLDPQHRLFLQIAWKAIEDAGYAPGSLAHSRTGVFVGISTNDHAELVARGMETIEAAAGTGGAHCLLPNRLSYLLNLRGPSEPVDTACSSSLVAIHRAVRSLQEGESDLAIAGGVNVMLSPSPFIAFSKAGMLSRHGRCRSFGAGADGYVRGEGCGAILLKPLGRALADGDTIHAIIRGTGVSHGGRARSLTAPNPKSQADLLVGVHDRAGVSPDTVGYIEAHGTGTALGDPIEIEGLKTAFEELARRHGSELAPGGCAVGSVKSNIGHLESAAGIAGVLKVLLAMRHGVLPASLHCTPLNPELRVAGTPFRILDQAMPWPSRRDATGAPIPRRAGVSSFGFGGVNAHVLLEAHEPSAADTDTAAAPAAPQLILLSARRAGVLRDQAAALLAHVERAPLLPLGDLAYTLQVGRDAMPHRLAFVAASPAEITAALGAFLQGDHATLLTGLVERAAHGAAPADPPRSADDWQELGRRWVGGESFAWATLHAGARRRIPLPTYPFERKRHWAFEAGTPVPMAGVAAPPAETPPVPAQGAAAPAEARAEEPPARPAEHPPGTAQQQAVLGWIRQALAEVLGFAAEELRPASRLDDIGLTSITAMSLIDGIEAKWGLRCYPSEFVGLETVADLAIYLAGEIDRAPQRGTPAQPIAVAAPGLPAAVAAPVEATTPVAPGTAPADKPVVFILSAPRSGSTLLRAMLAGHPALFAPPELHLLGFATAAERRDRLAGSHFNEGLVEALRTLRPCDADAAAAEVAAMAEQGWTTGQVYAHLRALAGARQLVDKSPSYGKDIATLRQAEQLLQAPLYIHLVRHPLAAMESFTRNRFDRLLGQQGADPWQTAETVWTAINDNILRFLEEIPATRVLRLHFEDLVRQPERMLRAACDFLGLDFSPRLLDPYEGERMTRGLHRASLSIGDPNFLKHGAIEPGLADAWQDRLPPGLALAEASEATARQVGYHPAPPLALPQTPAQRLARRLHGEAGWTLQHRLRLPAGPCERAQIETIWQHLLQRHWSLRSYLSDRDGEPLQREATAPRPMIGSLDLSGLPAEARDASIERLLDEAGAALAADHWPGFNATLVRCGPHEHELLWTCSHYLADGVATSLLSEQLAGIAAPGVDGAGADYLHYCQAVSELLEPNELRAALAFHRGLGEPAPLALPTDASGPNVAASERELVVRRAWPGLLAWEHAAAALYDCLGAWTGQAEVAIAHRLHRRQFDRRSFQAVVGCLAGDVPLPMLVDEAPLAVRTARLHGLLRALPAAGVSYDALALAGDLALPWDAAPVRLNYQPMASGSRAGYALRTVPRAAPGSPRGYLLDLVVRARRDEIEVIARYSANLHRAETVRGLVERWLDLAAASARLQEMAS